MSPAEQKMCDAYQVYEDACRAADEFASKLDFVEGVSLEDSAIVRHLWDVEAELRNKLLEACKEYMRERQEKPA
jgi:hypothetical protein